MGAFLCCSIIISFSLKSNSSVHMHYINKIIICLLLYLRTSSFHSLTHSNHNQLSYFFCFILPSWSFSSIFVILFFFMQHATCNMQHATCNMHTPNPLVPFSITPFSHNKDDYAFFFLSSITIISPFFPERMLFCKSINVK